ncbi:MAG: ABC transporter permease [Aggregatilineales bacterium]
MEQSYPLTKGFSVNFVNTRAGISAFLALIVAVIVLGIGINYANLAHDNPLLTESTLAELAVWMSEQSAMENPPSILASLTRQWFGGDITDDNEGGADVNQMVDLMQSLFLVWCVVTIALIGVGIVGFVMNATWTRNALISALFGMDMLIFLIPTVDNETLLLQVLVGIILMLVIVLTAPGKVTRIIGFMVAISVLLVVWEASKYLAESVNYTISVPRNEWQYTTYPTLEEGLEALSAGQIDVVMADSNDVEEIMPAYPVLEGEADDLPYPDLRYYDRLQRNETVLIFPIQPDMAGRLTIAVRAEDAGVYNNPSDLTGATIGAVDGDFAVDRFLAEPRTLNLLNLKILNDLNLPHLEDIAGAFLQPARRNGDFLLMRILAEAGIYTLREAVLGFTMGVLLGFMLGTLFAHSKLMERALLPYAVASQTVPILAIAPMVVIWLGASYTSVAVIAAYITFFPVAINTLRGLQSPAPLQVELMQSYAASWWTILWKLRFPAALPYIFTALKVSATASVVGAVIGELPSGIGAGLGRAILDFSSNYSLTSTPKLWAAIVTASIAGMIFFLTISALEQWVLSRYSRSTT